MNARRAILLSHSFAICASVGCAAPQRFQQAASEDGSHSGAATEATVTAPSTDPESGGDGDYSSSAGNSTASSQPSTRPDAEHSSASIASASESSDGSSERSSKEASSESSSSEGGGTEGEGSSSVNVSPNSGPKELLTALVHRYSFVSADPTSAVVDLLGGADALVFGGRSAEDGSLIVDGPESHVSLPEGILSTFTQATVDIWTEWWGGDENQRILNFGREPERGDAPSNYLSLSPKGSDGLLTVQFRTDGGSRGQKLETGSALATGSLQHLTLVVHERRLELFVNGSLAADAETSHALTALDDRSNWLGRALYGGYPGYNGSFYELRIFDRALLATEVGTLHEAGLDLARP